MVIEKRRGETADPTSHTEGEENRVWAGGNLLNTLFSEWRFSSCLQQGTGSRGGKGKPTVGTLEAGIPSRDKGEKRRGFTLFRVSTRLEGLEKEKKYRQDGPLTEENLMGRLDSHYLCFEIFSPLS